MDGRGRKNVLAKRKEERRKHRKGWRDGTGLNLMHGMHL